MTLRPTLAAWAGNLIEPVLDRIGAHAVGDPGELREILCDLFRRDVRGRNQRRLQVANGA